MPKPLKNDDAWKILFERHSILQKVKEKGFFEISAAEINTLREARLMTKFDHAAQLPQVFKDNKLTIQPVSRGSYIIGEFESYLSVEDDEKTLTEHVPFPVKIQTINPYKLYSESAAILCAHVSGMISSIINEEVTLTVLGRMSTGIFEFDIQNTTSKNKHHVKVENSQCEIDAGFESETSLVILEAKNETISDFLIRQLYYPYRLWREKSTKKVIPVFMIFSNDIFTFNIYNFNDPNCYNSIELIKQFKFRIAPQEITFAEIKKISEEVKIIDEPRASFPQANKFTRIIDILNQLIAAGGTLTQDYITENYDFDRRQTQYYTGAANYLGLTVRNEEETGVSYSLSSLGNRLMKLHPDERNLGLVKSILSRRVFNDSFQLYLKNSRRPSGKQVVEIMKSTGIKLDVDGQTTAARRAQTVLSWLDWILSLPT